MNFFIRFDRIDVDKLFLIFYRHHILCVHKEIDFERFKLDSISEQERLF